MRGLQEPTSGEPLQSALEALDQAHYAIIAAKDALAQSQNSMPYQSYPAPLQPTGAVESQAPAESQFLVADSAAYAAFTPFAAPSVVSEWLSGIPADTSAIPAAIKGKQAYCGKCHLEGRDSETHSAQDCPFKAHREVKKAKHRVKNGAKKRRDRDRLEKFKEKKRGERWIKKAGDMILEDMGFKDMFEHPKKVEEESARAIEESWESFVEMLN
ncbi:uncharacterized protein BDZ99DRAFT_201103 [Mytilinidion resinicola]|uniref:Uncharacterized protein n=1 Tax=Mytilinidion resinicola TaxID=574789 RepID=A0A6A6Y487_9PEZI|nr:uncharacterized protein BDZ99DRAFT_201103 [Mytilinidion resinicola]KAF2802607.1 hypothetical protein BDZ99DRAFT_201103 [Mytilinidion resinicola]